MPRNKPVLSASIDVDSKPAKKGLDQAGAEFAELGKEAEDSAKTVADAGTKFEKTIEGMVKAGAALAGAGLAAAAAGVVEGVTGAINAEEVGNKLTAQFALAPEDSARFGQIAGEVYGQAWGDSLEDVGDDLFHVVRNLGTNLANEDIFDFTTKSIDISKVFDLDAERLNQTLGLLVRTGMVDSAAGAFDVLTASLQQINAPAADVIDNFWEFSAPVKSLGLNAEEFAETTRRAADKGVFDITKIGDAFLELSIRAVDGSESTRDAYELMGLEADAVEKAFLEGGDSAKQATSDIINGLGRLDDKAREHAGNALFGTMYEELGYDAIAALDPIRAKMEGIDGSADTLSENLNSGLGVEFEELKRKAELALVGFADEHVVPFVENELVPALKDLAPHLDEVGDKAAEAFEEGVTFIEDTGEALGKVAEHEEAVAAVATTLAIVALLELGGTVKDVDGLAGALRNVGLSDKEFWKQKAPAAAIIAAVVAGTVWWYNNNEDFRIGIEVLGDEWDRFWERFETGSGRMNEIGDRWAQDTWAVIYTVQDGWGQLKGEYNSLTTRFESGAGKLNEMGDRWAQDTWATVYTVQAGWGQLKDDFGGLQNRFRDGADKVGDAFRSIPGKIASAGSAIFNAAKGVGQAIVNGIVSGLKAVGGFLGDVFGAVKSGLKTAVNEGVVNPLNRGIPDHLGKPPFFVDLPNNPIPRLAEGALTGVDDPFIAVVGDNPTQPEIISPVDKMRDTFDEVIKANFGSFPAANAPSTRGGNNYHVEITVQGSVISERDLVEKVKEAIRNGNRVNRRDLLEI